MLYRVELGLSFELQKSGVGKVGSCSTNVIVAVAEVPDSLSAYVPRLMIAGS